MQKFTPLTFLVPPLKGMRETTIKEHIKLYEGYVSNANLVIQKLEDLKKDVEANAYTISELGRRFSFEFNGMRNHEIYFKSLEGGAQEMPESKLRQAIEKQWGSMTNWQNSIKSLAMTRGIGWAMLYFDHSSKQLLNSWVDEQHLGQLQNCALIFGIDMWEHSYVADYQPSGKKKYIEDFMSNVNWDFVAKNSEEYFS